jgi:predicted TIM-barrel fold metal-dependent hydrolase
MSMIIDELGYYREVDLPIFQAEFADWLPKTIFDVHAHSWLPEHNLAPSFKERVGLIFEAESVSKQELQEAYNLLFPNKHVEYLAFGMPLTTVDRTANNHYIARSVNNKTSFGLYVAHPSENAETLEQKLKEGKLVGFKPYLSYVTWKALEEVRIRDFLTDAMLEVAHAYSLPVMLHVPREKRLADPENIKDLRYISTHYPKAKMILAHAGRAYSLELIRSALAKLEGTDFWLEFSNVQSTEVIEEVLKRMRLERVMYGSDIPVAAVRGYMFMLNGQRVMLTRKPFLWSISGRPDQLRCTFMGYEQLRAMKRGCEALGFGKDEVQRLFYDNAKTLVEDALKSMRG